MRARPRSARLVLVPGETKAVHADREILDGLLPALVLLLVALARLAAFAWHPDSWGVEESIALAFALVAGFLLTQYLPEPKGASSGDSAA